MTPDPFSSEISRDVFLRGSIKLFALGTLAVGGVHCGPGAGTPELKGLSEQQYRNINSLGEIFLKDNPLPEFDLGLAFDRYLFGQAYPLPEPALGKALELADVPSSWLAALVLDGSLTPLVKLEPAAREKRMLDWRDSDSVLKKGLFNIMRSTCYFMLSSSPQWYEYCGYPRNAGGMIARAPQSPANVSLI